MYDQLALVVCLVGNGLSGCWMTDQMEQSTIYLCNVPAQKTAIQAALLGNNNLFSDGAGGT